MSNLNCVHNAVSYTCTHCVMPALCVYNMMYMYMYMYSCKMTSYAIVGVFIFTLFTDIHVHVVVIHVHCAIMRVFALIKAVYTCSCTVNVYTIRCVYL